MWNEKYESEEDGGFFFLQIDFGCNFARYNYRLSIVRYIHPPFFLRLRILALEKGSEVD